jgi:galactofuranose transport system permease protein
MRRLLANLPVLTAFTVLVLFSVAVGLRHPGFLSKDVFLNILRDNAFLGIVAAGETFVILSGGIDLSVGAIVGLTTVCVSWLITAGVHPLVAILICLAGGTLFGATMGKIVSSFKVPAFLVTLAGMFLARGLAYLVSTDASVISHPLYDQMAGTWWLAPALFAAVILIGHYILNFRQFGRTVYAVGGSETASVLMGLNPGSCKVGIYAISGFCAALGGVAYTLYTISGDPNAAVTLELDAITSVVIGGTLLSGGYGSLAGTVIGVLILGAIQTALTYEDNVSSWWSKIIVGGLLLLFLLIQKAVEKGVLRLFNRRNRRVGGGLRGHLDKAG